MTFRDSNANRVSLLLLVLLLLLAAALRLYRLDTLPAGLHHDEASNGMLALDILAGKWPVFFSDYTGKEAGYMYLVALSTSLFGQTVLAVRLPAALAGVALVPAVYLAGRRAAMGEGGALLAAGAAVGAPWLLHINRIGFRASLLPLLLTLWAWLLLRALHTNARRDWIGAGVLLGLTAHTYTASRLVPLLVVLFVGHLALWHRSLVRRYWRGLATMLTAAALLASPLLFHYLRHPADWSERLDQIGACAGNGPVGACLGQVAANLGATLAMVGWRGDPLGFFNLPDAPALPLAVGWLFYVGLVVALRRAHEPAMALLLLWWGVLILPGALSKDSPHFLRTIGAAPPTMLLWALPLAEVGRRWNATATKRKQAVLVVLSLALLAVVVGSSTGSYFGRWATRPALYYEYMGYASDAAHAAARLPPNVLISISEEYERHPTYTYLEPRTAEARWFDARYGWPRAAPGQRNVYIISPSTPTDERIAPYTASAAGENVLNEQGHYAYTILHMEPPDNSAAGVARAALPAVPMRHRIGGVSFQGITATQAGDNLKLTLFWEARNPTRRRLRVFVHLVDVGGKMVAQHDALGYPSREWRAGEQFVTLHTIPLPDHAVLSEDYALELGLYDVETLERLPLHGREQETDTVRIPLARLLE